MFMAFLSIGRRNPLPREALMCPFWEQVVCMYACMCERGVGWEGLGDVGFGHGVGLGRGRLGGLGP